MDIISPFHYFSRKSQYTVLHITAPPRLDISGRGAVIIYAVTPRSNPGWQPDFPHPSRPGLGVHPASYTMGTGSFPWVKRSGRGVDHPPHLAPRLKKELRYTYTSPLGHHGLLYDELHLYHSLPDIITRLHHIALSEEEQLVQITATNLSVLYDKGAP